MNYYNEWDKKTAAWLRELIAAGLIPKGEVDERSITDVQPGDLRGFTQCHFFAGIGGWAYALRRSSWPESRPVWTGSCPCQPFSCAGKQQGFRDDRHLWPSWFSLISKCRPPVIFGEQVASPIALQWLDGVFDNLEGEGYACGASDLCAASVGAPHIRQRLYWVADSKCARRAAAGSGLEINPGWRPEQGQSPCGLADATLGGLRTDGIAPRSRHAEQREQDRGLGNAAGCGPARQNWTGEQEQGFGPGRNLGFWADSKWHLCRDGKLRRIPTKPALFPLAHGLPERMGILRGSGNAIVPQLAAEFIKAYLEIE